MYQCQSPVDVGLSSELSLKQDQSCLPGCDDASLSIEAWTMGCSVCVAEGKIPQFE